ncbi:MAG: PQQ-dependent sugar dehydrogenase, partial [Shimia sp.]
GENYSGSDIPDHTEGDGFTGPLISWVPAISPAGLVIYEGDMFADWDGDAIMGGLSSQALIRVDIEDGTAREAARYTWDRRIRDVEVAADGALWVLEDNRGRLIKLTAEG